MKGKLYGVGAGPGDPELLTLKALRIVKECDVIAIPAKEKENCVAYAIVEKIYPEIADKKCVFLDFPMTKDPQVLKRCHNQIRSQIIDQLDEGKKIAFLTLGDPTIYSTYFYMHQAVKEKGYEAEIISGVPSFCAVAAKLEISLAEKEEEIHIIPATYGIAEFMKLPGTKILMKAGKKLGEIKKCRFHKTAFLALSEKCGMQDEKMAVGIENIPDEAGYYSTVIMKSH